MNALLLLGCFFAVCMVVCELLLQEAKLQTRFGRILSAHVLFFIGAAITMDRFYEIHPPAVFVFWIGAFLSWFGIRSHIESSILIRMIFLLSEQPRKPEELIKDYERHYSSALRLDELERAGLLEKKGYQLQLTGKGLLVLRIARFLAGSR